MEMSPIEELIEQNKAIYTMDERTLEIKNKFIRTEKLYHFTTFKNALNIINSSSIKFSKMKKLNDINESYRPACSDFSHCSKLDNLDLIEKEIRKYRQICFSRDKKRNKKSSIMDMAFTVEPMWGHYAEKGCGVCLVFDKSKLLENCGDDIWYGNIVYSEAHDNSIKINGNTSKEIIEKLFRNRKKFFFTKTTSWKYEQEFRLVKRCNGRKNEFLEFNDSIIAVIMYSAKNWPANEHCSGSGQYMELRDTLVNKNVPIFFYCSAFGERLLTYNDHEIFRAMIGR